MVCAIAFDKNPADVVPLAGNKETRHQVATLPASSWEVTQLAAGGPGTLAQYLLPLQSSIQLSIH